MFPQWTERLGFYCKLYCVCAHEYTHTVLSSVYLPVLEFFTFESVAPISQVLWNGVLSSGKSKKC